MKYLSFTTQEFVRVELEDALSTVMDKELLMVIAPSGYGKSTLVRQFLEKQAGLSYLWFPMHREEKDENWIWVRICNKLGESSSGLKERLMQTELPKTHQEIQYVIQLIKEYIKQPLYLVLDDYQECNSDAFSRLLEAIVMEHTCLHIMLLSRIYPDIPYEEMFLKGDCAVLNQHNLTLSKEETAQIFKINQITLSQEQLTQLYEYTDGWISAVYLSLYAYKRQGDFGHFSNVNHLMKTAVFDKLTPQMKEFYMKMSLFDWFHLDGAAYVSEMEFFENAFLESRERFGFIHYDATNQTFTMHTLLRTVAGAELEKSDIDIVRLYDRAGQWSEKKQVCIKAVQYYLKSKNFNQIAALYAGEQGKNLIEQAPELFEEVRLLIDDSIWSEHIMALLNYLYYLATRKNVAKVYPYYESTLRKLQESEVWKADKKVWGEMLVLQSTMQFNDLGKINVSLKEACRLLGNTTSALLGNSLLTYGTVCMTVLYYNKSGDLLKVIEQEKEYTRYYMALTRNVQNGWDAFFDAEYAMMTGDMDTAYRLAEQVCRQTVLRKQTCIVISCYYIMLRCLIYFGKYTEFREKIREMDQQLKEVINPVLCMDAELAQGYMYACLGQRENMAEWIRNFKLENCSKPIRDVRSGCMTYGMLLVKEKNWDMLDMIGEQMLVPYKSTVHIYPKIVGYLYKAIARYHLGQKEAATENLKQAVELAEPDGVTIPFIENAKELEPIAKEMGVHPFFEMIEPMAAQYKKGIKAVSVRENEAEIVLTDREQELMCYVQKGYKNAQISEKMHIAQVTVEKNLTSIYRKLHVKNRTAALKKWQELL